MGTYFWLVNHTKREKLKDPHASKLWEWNHPKSPSANVVLWALFSCWNGDRIEVVNDDWEEPARFDWPNVWTVVEADYHRHLRERGVSLERGFDGCKHGFPWAKVGACEECFPKPDGGTT